MSTANQQPLRERIEFTWNIPHHVVLEGNGTAQAGRDGPEWRYFLGGHRIMWIPQEAHAQIERLQASAGSELIITKHKTGRNAATWTVAEAGDAAPPPEETRTAKARNAKAPETNEAGNQALYTCLCAAIRTAAAAEKFAASIGRPLAFETPDLRALATTLYIEATRR